MNVSPPMHELVKHRVLQFYFMVHLLKVTRLPSHVSTPDVLVPTSSSPKRDFLKVTALYSSKQVALGEFQVSHNECPIDKILICHLNLSKSDARSKLHVYIDQAHSSGLTGHLALDLKEFIQEGNTEVYLKYPLYVNISKQSQGPVLKVTVQLMEKAVAAAFFDEEDDIVLARQQSTLNRSTDILEASCTSGYPFQDHNTCLTQEFNFHSLTEIEGVLSDIGKKLDKLVSTCRSTECFSGSDSASGEVEYLSSTNSPLFSSINTGTSLDSTSDLYEEQLSELDIFNSYQEVGNTTFPNSRHARTLSDITSFSSNLAGSKVLEGGRVRSTNDVADSSNIMNDEHDNQSCWNDCIVCSTGALCSYEGIYSTLSRSKSVSSSQHLCYESSVGSEITGRTLPAVENHGIEMEQQAHIPKTKKGPGLLRSLFGAVVVAGVSILGARSANLGKKDQLQGNAAGSNRGAVSPKTVRTVRDRYKFRSARFNF